jgi:predicted RNase H-like HicB family nuclease
MRYAIVIEKGLTSYGAYVPDLPGCVAAAKTQEEVVALIREAIESHLETMREQGLPIPEPSSKTDFVEVAPV